MDIKNDNLRYRIYSYGRAFVIVAHDSQVTRETDSDGIHYYKVLESATIRLWNTQHGLSQRCVRGPETAQLDANPCVIEIPLMAVHDRRECLPTTDKDWDKALREAKSRLVTGAT